MKNDDLRTLLIAMAIVFVMAVSALLGYGALKFLGPTVKNTISSIEDTIRGKAETEEIVEVPEDTSDDDADKEDAEDVKDAEDDVTAEEIPDQPVTSYKVQNTRDYNGPRICQAHSYIYNSDGKVVDDFHDEDTYYLEMTLNVDASEAILVYETGQLRVSARSYDGLLPQMQAAAGKIVMAGGIIGHIKFILQAG